MANTFSVSRWTCAFASIEPMAFCGRHKTSPAAITFQVMPKHEMKAFLKKGIRRGRKIYRNFCFFVKLKIFAICKSFKSSSFFTNPEETELITTGNVIKMLTATGTKSDFNAKTSSKMIATMGVVRKIVTGSLKKLLKKTDFPQKKPKMQPKIIEKVKLIKKRCMLCKKFQ